MFLVAVVRIAGATTHYGADSRALSTSRQRTDRSACGRTSTDALDCFAVSSACKIGSNDGDNGESFQPEPRLEDLSEAA